MSGAYVSAIQHALGGFLNLLVRLALPLAILVGLAMLALTIGYYLRRESAEGSLPLLQSGAARLMGFALVGLAFVVCWAALSQTRPVTVEALRWKDAADEVANPTEDAPAIIQYGPSAAILSEKTFTRTATIPLEIGRRIEEGGVEMLSQYLSDSGSENVSAQSDKLEKRGELYFLTRNVTRLDETPIAFQKSDVTAKFDPLGSRAYAVTFRGTYAFRNPGSEPARVRFTFPLPDEGTVDRLKVSVGPEPASPDDDGDYVWSAMLGPGESRTAAVEYQVVGSKTWHYDVGSRRRPVDEFNLRVESPVPVKFVRGSLQPSKAGATPSWHLSNVVTNQQVAVGFPTDQVARESFVQTMAMLPAALALFAVGLIAAAWRFRVNLAPPSQALAIALFAFGLGGSAVLANYLGSVGGVLASLALGVLGTTLLLGRWSLIASLPAALFAAAFLSAEHTGIIVAAVGIGTAAASWFLRPTSAT